MISHSQRTVKVYTTGLRHLEKLVLQNHQCGLDALVSKIKLGELDVYKILRDFVVHLDKSGAKPASIKTWVASVKGFFRHYWIRIYSEDFKQAIRMPKQIHYREEPITKEILVRRLHNVTPRIQTVILVAVASGMRIGEIVQLRISDIDFASRPVKIRIRAEIAKGKTSRETFLTSETTSALKDNMKDRRLFLMFFALMLNSGKVMAD